MKYCFGTLGDISIDNFTTHKHSNGESSGAWSQFHHFHKFMTTQNQLITYLAPPPTCHVRPVMFDHKLYYTTADTALPDVTLNLTSPHGTIVLPGQRRSTCNADHFCKAKPILHRPSQCCVCLFVFSFIIYDSGCRLLQLKSPGNVYAECCKLFLSYTFRMSLCKLFVCVWMWRIAAAPTWSRRGLECIYTDEPARNRRKS